MCYLQQLCKSHNISHTCVYIWIIRIIVLIRVPFFYKWVTVFVMFFFLNRFHQIATAESNGVYVRRGRSIACLTKMLALLVRVVRLGDPELDRRLDGPTTSHIDPYLQNTISSGHTKNLHCSICLWMHFWPRILLRSRRMKTWTRCTVPFFMEIFTKHGWRFGNKTGASCCSPVPFMHGVFFLFLLATLLSIYMPQTCNNSRPYASSDVEP
jgi:hypothetical protein